MQAEAPKRPAWNRYNVYLFDIDGTLLHCRDAVHYFAFCDALSWVAGKPLNLDGVATQGNVDVAILRDAFALAGVPEDLWRPRLGAMRERMVAHVGRHRADFAIDVLPGVRDVLEHLRARGAILGTATGNLEGVGLAKLESCGLLPLFHFGGWSDAHESRSEVFRAAVAQARKLAGEAATLCVVGDTPADVQAAQANGLDVIAVATGIFSFEALRSERPTRCIHWLNDLLVEGAF